MTSEQVTRQGDVDNIIFGVIEACNPTTTPIEWDIEMIGEVRDVIERWIVDNLKLCSSEEFYP